MTVQRISILFLITLPHWLGAQLPAVSWDTFAKTLANNHPLAKSAAQADAQAQAALLRARGGFDPKVFSDYEGKSFKGKNYYQILESGVKLPTWAGLELKAGYQYVSGAYLNPEQTLPANGQAVAGLSWSLGQGLMMDERRLQLKLAQIGVQAAGYQRQELLNDLALDAGKAFWSWAWAENQLKLYRDALQQAEIRHKGLVESVRQGDKAAIDTVETWLQWQTRKLDYNFAQTDQQQAVITVAAFWWGPDNRIVDTAQLRLMVPALDNNPMPSQLPASPDVLQHPTLQLYRLKLKSLEAEQQMKQEKRKPTLDVQYNFLGSGWNFFPSDPSGLGFLTNDVKWGVQFSYPLLNRKARGDWQAGKLKIMETNWSLQDKQQQLQAKAQTYALELENLKNQIDLFRNMVTGYRALLDAEAEKFRQGESSIFLINTREQRWLDAQVKLLKLQAEYRKAEIGLNWAYGTLGKIQ